MIKTTPKPLLQNLQALRGIAALMVCAFHYRYTIHDPFFQNLFSNGWIGVQIFFMISGFIMVQTTRKINNEYGRESVQFFLRRIIRIVPIYYFAIFIFIADDLNNGYLAQHAHLLITTLLFLSPMTVMSGPDYGAPVLELGWTLNYEMIFYLIFAISLLFGKLRYLFIYSLFFFLLVLIPFIAKGYITPDYKTFHDYSFLYLNLLTNPILVNFLFGVTAGILIPKIKLSILNTRILLCLSLVVFLVYFLGIFNIPFNAYTDLLFCGLLVVAVVLNDFHTGGIRFPKWLVGPGNFSYSLYLMHPMALTYLKLMFYLAGFEAMIYHSWFFFIALAFALAVAWISYQLLEKKLTNFLKGKILK